MTDARRTLASAWTRTQCTRQRRSRGAHSCPETQTAVHCILATLVGAIMPDVVVWYAYSCIVQCVHAQPVIDGFLVYYSGSLDLPFNRNNLRMLPWQTKYRQKAAPLSLVSQLAPPGIADEALKTIQIRSGSSVYSQMVTTQCYPSDIDSTPQTKKKRHQWPPYNVSSASRVVISIRGCSASVYPGLKIFGCEAKVKELLLPTKGPEDPCAEINRANISAQRRLFSSAVAD
ncbi:hypothetical protein BXZ70DRAFT_98198 [Cristinia sonorae]|uniref:Uncharacterized protein n=1 Tax=Cristinia sonorae TaxID=1940300 RepID=A0A8K0UR36_9AGAR|nr:hypothetical protein BXZ70DRAFT_98198 [Cristinia sonorae]